MELVADLVDEIRKSHEHQYIHGRYLDPLTLKWVDEDDDMETKTATFVSLPAFSTDYPRIHTTDREFEGHPVRSLLQSRYRLESTDRRDKTQVITHHNEDRVVVVPQIWALIVNNYVVITCGPINARELLGKTIQTRPYPSSSTDSNPRDLFFSDIQGNAFNFTDLHITDPQGKVSCVPLALCQTWFGLVKHIVEDCIDDEFDSLKEKLKYELLDGGPAFKLVTDEESLVTMYSWLDLVKTKTGIIHIKIVDRQEKFKRLLVTHHQEKAHESNVASDDSSIITDDRGNDATEQPTDSISDGTSDTTISSTASSTAEGKSRNLANKLHSLQVKLQEAKTQVNWERVLALSNEIPSLEARILKWTAENLSSELREKGHVFEEDETTLPPSLDQPWDAHPVFSRSLWRTSFNESLRSRSSLHSRSRSGCTSPFQRPEQLIPSSDVSMRASELIGSLKQSTVPRNSRRKVSPARDIPESSSLGSLRPRAASRERSYVPSYSRAPLRRLSCQQSGWDTIRPHGLSSQAHSEALTQTLPKYCRNFTRPGKLNDLHENRQGSRGLSFHDEKQRGKLTSDKRSGTIRDNTFEPQALRDYTKDVGQDCDEAVREISRNDSLANRANRLPAVVTDWLRLPKALRAPPAPDISLDASEIRTGESARSKQQHKDGAFENSHSGTRPVLRRLVNLIHKATAIFPHLNVGEESKNPSASFVANSKDALPIFLWPTKRKPFTVVTPSTKVPRPNSVIHEEATKSFSATLNDTIEEEIKVSGMEEQVLQTLLADAHNSLMKPLNPRRTSLELAMFYQGTIGRNAIEAESLVTPKGRVNNNRIFEKANSATRVEQGKMERADGENSNLDATAVGRSGLSAGTSNDMIEHVPESPVLLLKSDVFVLAGNLLHAFVPAGYDAPVVSKYWGAVHKLLRQDVLLAGDLPVTQIIASTLLKLHERVLDVQQGMRTIDGRQPTLDQLPKSLIVAFQKLLMLFVVAGNMAELCRSNNSNPNFIPRNELLKIFNDCNKSLIQGRVEIIELLSSDHHDGSAGSLAIDSEALLLLIIANFAFHSSESETFNLTKTYRDHTTNLRSLVRNRAYVRVHDHIPLLIEELDVVIKILKQQHRTLHKYSKIIDIGPVFGITHLSLTVLSNLMEKINERIRTFEELLIEAESALAQSRLLKTESNNKAILVFTVTTIIFLPLSFVTSYLGMNTSDLRDMQSKQTLFWEIGVPVAFLVFGIALLTAYYGEVTHRVKRIYWRGKGKI